MEGNHLKLYESLEDQIVEDPVTGARYSFEAGEVVHAMDSHKVCPSMCDALYGDLQSSVL